MKSETVRAKAMKLTSLVIVIMFSISAFSIIIPNGSIVAEPIVDSMDGATTSGGVTRSQFWTQYANGTIERDRFPVNYWNSVESQWMEIDTDIYREYFSDYYWTNVKNTMGTHFKEYCEADKTKVTFYKMYEGVRTPTDIVMGVNTVYWDNGITTETIDTLNTISEGTVVGDTIQYEPFDDCVETKQIGRNNLQTSYEFVSLTPSTIGGTVSLAISGEVEIGSQIDVYVDGVYWDEVGVASGESVAFGFALDDIIYALDEVTAFDNDMTALYGHYDIEKISGDTFTYTINVYYSDFTTLVYPITVDPNWWATLASTIEIGYDDYDSSLSGVLSVGGSEERYNDGISTNIAVNSQDYSVTLLPATYAKALDYVWNFDSLPVGYVTIPPSVGPWDYDDLPGSGGNTKIRIDDGNVYGTQCTRMGTTSTGLNADPYVGHNLVHDSARPFEALELKTYMWYHITDGDYFRDLWFKNGGDASEQRFTFFNKSGDTAFEVRIGVEHEHSGVPYGSATYYANYTVIIGGAKYLTLPGIAIPYSGSANQVYNFPILNVSIVDIDYSTNRFLLNVTDGTTYGQWWFAASSIVDEISSYRVHGKIRVSNYHMVRHYIDDVREYVLEPVTYQTGGAAYSDLIDTTLNYQHGVTNETGFVYRYDNLEIETTQPAFTDVKAHVQFYNGAVWGVIPESDIPNNVVGFDGDGIPISVDLSELNVTKYAKIRMQFNLTTTDNTITPSVDSWNFNVLSAEEDGSTAVLNTEDVSMEAPVTDYGGNGNIIIDIGDSSWVGDPYFQLWYKRAATIPDVNDPLWILVEDDIHYSPDFTGVPPSFSPVANSSNVQIQYGNPNNGIYYSYLWYPTDFVSSFDTYWFKTIVRDTSYETSDQPTRVLFLITEIQAEILVNGAPIANAGLDVAMPTNTNHLFDADINTADGGGGVSGVDAIDYCNWTFEATSSDWNITHNRTVWTVADGAVTQSFPDNDIYIATLTLGDVHGLMDTDTAVVTITNKAPVVDIEVVEHSAPYEVGIQTDVFFDARGTTDADGILEYCRWDWDDGTWTNGTFYEPDNASFVFHSYNTSGNYTITLYIEDDDSLNGVETVDVEAVVGIPVATIADAQGNVISLQTIRVVQFERVSLTAGSSSAGSGDIETYSWDWGDGNTNDYDSPLASHIYSIVDTYFVTLEIETSLHYFDETYCYIDVISAGEDDVESDDFLSLGKNPRFKYNVTEGTDGLDVSVAGIVNKDGWGGTWFERYMFKESVTLSINRVRGPMGSTDGDENATANATADEEIVLIQGEYFESPINDAGAIGYSGVKGDNIWIFVKIETVWYHCNIAVPDDVTIKVSSGDILITFDVVWDEIKILTNPGFYKKYISTPTSPNMISSGLNVSSFSGITYMEACIECED